MPTAKGTDLPPSLTQIETIGDITEVSITPSYVK